MKRAPELKFGALHWKNGSCTVLPQRREVGDGEGTVEHMIQHMKSFSVSYEI